VSWRKPNGEPGVKKNGTPGATGRALLNNISNSSVPPITRFQLGLALFVRGQGKHGAGFSGYSQELQQQPQQQSFVLQSVHVAQPPAESDG
jgi:hypothetical protein